MKIEVTGDMQLKFTFLGIVLGTIKQNLNKNITVDTSKGFPIKRNIGLKGDLDLVLELNENKENENDKEIVITSHVIYHGFEIFTHTDKLFTTNKETVITVPEFNRFGFKLTNTSLKISL